MAEAAAREKGLPPGLEVMLNGMTLEEKLASIGCKGCGCRIPVICQHALNKQCSKPNCRYCHCPFLGHPGGGAGEGGPARRQTTKTYLQRLAAGELSGKQYMSLVSHVLAGDRIESLKDTPDWLHDQAHLDVIGHCIVIALIHKTKFNAAKSLASQILHSLSQAVPPTLQGTSFAHILTRLRLVVDTMNEYNMYYDNALRSSGLEILAKEFHCRHLQAANWPNKVASGDGGLSAAPWLGVLGWVIKMFALELYVRAPCSPVFSAKNILGRTADDVRAVLRKASEHAPPLLTTVNYVADPQSRKLAKRHQAQQQFRQIQLQRAQQQKQQYQQHQSQQHHYQQQTPVTNGPTLRQQRQQKKQHQHQQARPQRGAWRDTEMGGVDPAAMHYGGRALQQQAAAAWAWQQEEEQQMQQQMARWQLIHAHAAAAAAMSNQSSQFHAAGRQQGVLPLSAFMQQVAPTQLGAAGIGLEDQFPPGLDGLTRGDCFRHSLRGAPGLDLLSSSSTASQDNNAADEDEADRQLSLELEELMNGSSGDEDERSAWL